MIIQNTSSGAAPEPYVYIVSSAYASLPAPGNRVAPADAANMPTLVSAGSPSIAILTSAGAHHYRFVGMKIRPATGVSTNGIVRIGSGETSLANLPYVIIFDRCYLPGDPTVGGVRGIAINCALCALIVSYFA